MNNLQKIRCFISINIPEEIKDKITEIQNQIPKFKGKLTEKENLHLTLKFLGEISPEKIDAVKKILSEIRFKKFDAELKDLGCFDNRKSGNYTKEIIVWLSIEKCESLQKEIDEKLSEIFERKKRFMGHLTIARMKSLDNKKILLKEMKKIKFNPIKFQVKEFCLMKSELSKTGPKYSAIESYSLE